MAGIIQKPKNLGTDRSFSPCAGNPTERATRITSALAVPGQLY
jgi:hypothetical protein